MRMLLYKKKIYYFFGILAVTVICLLGDLAYIDGRNYSVFCAIWEQKETAFQICGLKEVFEAGVSGWMYRLLPVVSIPFISYFSEERKSRLHLYVICRTGTLRYLMSRVLYAFIGSTVILTAAIAVYVLIIARCFELNPSYAGAEVIGMELVSVWEMCREIIWRLVYLILYSLALSLLTAVFVYVHNDLYVDLSLVFLINYLLQDTFCQNKLIYVFMIMSLTGILYILVRTVRSEKV